MGNCLKNSSRWCPQGCGRIYRTIKTSNGTWYMCEHCRQKFTRKELEAFWEGYGK